MIILKWNDDFRDFLFHSIVAFHLFNWRVHPDIFTEIVLGLPSNTNHMQKITTCLWFKANAEEAIQFYVSVFKNSKIDFVSSYESGSSGPQGGFVTGNFRLEGQEFQALSLNAASPFSFSEAISLSVRCDTQDEVDYFWNKLSEGGSTSQCGWLKDKFGLSWQIVPALLHEQIQGKDTVKQKKVMEAMLKMTKFDIQKLKEAAE
jgi:predicted 3-demethylubiquinone-9 3-methyltransferase (glyoxalase superfamily)